MSTHYRYHIPEIYRFEHVWPQADAATVPSESLAPAIQFRRTQAFRLLCFQVAVALATVATTLATVKLYASLGGGWPDGVTWESLVAGTVFSAVLIRNLVGEFARFNPLKALLVAWKGIEAEGVVLKVQRLQEDSPEGQHFTQYELTYRFQDARGQRRVDQICTLPIAAALRLTLREGDHIPVRYLRSYPNWSLAPDFGGLIADVEPPRVEPIPLTRTAAVPVRGADAPASFPPLHPRVVRGVVTVPRPIARVTVAPRRW